MRNDNHQEQPLRSELFSPEQMRNHGKALAESHLVSLSRTRNNKLLTRLVENQTVLTEVHTLLAEAVALNNPTGPAAEWLLDNYYLIEEHIRTSKLDLPKGYCHGLPWLMEGQSQDLPRVYDIALERISHGDGLVEAETLSGFIDAYQSIVPLTLGELWAIPIMLRLALIENLRRVAVRVSSNLVAQREADTWATRIASSAESDPKSLILVIADMARSDPPMVSSFVAELARKLQGKGSALSLPLTWIEQRLAETNLTIERLVQSSMQQQAIDQVSISNGIRSLRSLEATNWKEFVESSSLVEQTLREDPVGWYARMDFPTRDRYRHVVESIARRVRLPEVDVARFAVDLAKARFAEVGADSRASHVGYYLVDQGLLLLHREARVRPTLTELLRNVGNRFALALYTGAATILSLVIATAFAAVAHSEGLSVLTLGLLALPLLMCAGGVSIALVNWVVTLLAQPKTLPQIDFTDGIPSEYRSMVVVPTMLMSASDIEHLFEALEVRLLANRDDNLFFAMLTDLPDADEEHLPSDSELVRFAERKTRELNERYGSTGNEPFFLFHRPRRWNSADRRWMGHERKRGKLTDLNALLRGDGEDRFDLLVGDTSSLSTVKYVITLDSDTQLPRDVARQLVGIMAHPLNRARYCRDRGRVVEGYGILQPRVAASFPGVGRSRYALLSGSEPGIDPYTRAVSDVYQDLFGEGSYIGKGIYDVDVFEESLKGRFPANRILSHDLLEGCHARSGLVSSVLLFEHSPSSYLADVERRRRWIRGDWQLLRWLLPRVPSSDGLVLKNVLSPLSKWKLLDNLRRSVTTAALTLVYLVGWVALTDPIGWTLMATGVVFLPLLILSAFDVVRRSNDTPVRTHLSVAIRASILRFEQSIFTLACLPYDAWFSLEAIARTVWRMLVTHRNLLEWKPSHEHAANVQPGLFASYRTMWPAPLFAAATLCYIVLAVPTAISASAPVLVLWLLSPAISWWLSRPLTGRRMKLSEHQITFLRRLARKTWAYFETFVTEEEHWLPPDNYQEVPTAKIAHRTSPTNIGLALLANLSAYDFAYLSANGLLTRTEQTLRSMARLERCRGHFLNWYDTRTMAPLPPHYISTVDSGNLAGHLLTLRSGLVELADRKIVPANTWSGIEDTGSILESVLDADAQAVLTRFRDDLDAARTDGATTLLAARIRLERMVSSAQQIVAALPAGADHQVIWWANALSSQCRGALEELDVLVPWISHEIISDNRFGIITVEGIPTLRELAESEREALQAVEALIHDGPTATDHDRLSSFRDSLVSALARADDRLSIAEALARQCEDLAGFDFTFLYNKRRRLLAIGYQVDAKRRDLGHYDLLASEARLASFIAIAQGQIPQENWFALGRLLADADGTAILFSWSGSMFEYLMPLLIMPTYENTLLDHSCKAAIVRQIQYGKRRDVPWGISESGYNLFDAGLNYRYRAFGVPGLGLKRGLMNDLVVAPYASALALLRMPEEACRNLERIADAGYQGTYGLYEAIDYTDSRVPPGQSSAVVRSYMAHHQGMSLLSIVACLLERPMQRRFEANPSVRATTLLLEEKTPTSAALPLRESDETLSASKAEVLQTATRVYGNSETAFPEVHLLSNGSYHVMVTNAGGGYSRWRETSVTRWHEDVTRDNWGTFLYVRDVQTGEFWSNTYQPVNRRPDGYEVTFSEGRAEFRRRDGDLETYTEIAVSPEDDIEVRRVRIANRSRLRRTIDITSYAEVVMTAPATDMAHPAFSNLFVQTEILEHLKAILCTRRPRSAEESPPWMLHIVTVRTSDSVEISYETDRMRFIGRNGSVAAPQAMSDGGRLSGTRGSVLDPIVAIRHRLVLEPESSVIVDMVTGVGETRDAAMRLVEEYQGKQFANRAFELAWTHSQMVLQQINATEADAQLYGRFASSILYARSVMRADPGILIENRRGQSDLWGYSISGDLPIVLLVIRSTEHIELVRQLVQAHAYWMYKGLAVDLVIWNEERSGYRQQLQEQILALIAAGVKANVGNRLGGIFVRAADQISSVDRVLLQAASRAIISDTFGPLEEQINGRSVPRTIVPRLATSRRSKSRSRATATPRRDLLFFNGMGGFAPDGREYVITIAADQVTPLPWTNVIANPDFGTVVSESGTAYTWSENAHEFRLTPWHNDPVTDPAGEAMYIRDEETGELWSPTPLPRRGETAYIVRHGFGYSVFEHAENGIYTEMWVYVAIDAPVKITLLKVRNDSGRTRRLSAAGYMELVLGEFRSKSAMHVITEMDPETGALLARNWYNTEFAGRTVFFDLSTDDRSVTCDRTEFIGRNGSLERPDAMTRQRLSGRIGAALDPCAAILAPFELSDGTTRELVFVFGVGRDSSEAIDLVRRFKSPVKARTSLDAVRSHWKHALGAVQVQTPDQSLDVLANGWLLYQVISCRLWGRSGFYQSGGAFGFRDQLQDAMALVHTEPALLRKQLLVGASRQFTEGDVQHWWHPPSGRGSRTHCSDDFLWLPYAVWRYVSSTADSGVLDEPVEFLDGRPVGEDAESYYDLPLRSGTYATLYEHCIRAIRRGMRRGVHELPLIGSGDWNDGMNMVGAEGKGESVWLGFFQYEVLTRFGEIANLRGDQPFVDFCREEAEKLRKSIEAHGWDGDWYRRAFFDDGSPLGSATNSEARIDSISQSWSVLSGAADRQRSLRAMESVDAHLVHRDSRVVQLLDPPFDTSHPNPGYIKGYVPGVRENGGQYTHAAIWVAMAFAQLRDRRQAWDIFSMINPVNHSKNADDVATYKVEPYVMAADVYSSPPHAGRGGWTWYTGSAGWMYRLIVESLLGISLEAGYLRLTPCIPGDWTAYTVHYRFGTSTYRINVEQTPGNDRRQIVSVDGTPSPDGSIALVDDGREHTVLVTSRTGAPIEPASFPSPTKEPTG